MKAIILAAGRGRRLGKYTESIPKCMLKVGEITIIEKQIAILRSVGIDEIIVVKGFAEEKINLGGVKYYVDREHCHNMVYSLFCAEAEMYGDIIISYGDILYEPQVVKKLLDAKGADVMVVADRLWKEFFGLRSADPYNDAESFRFDSDEFITNIGQSNPDPQDVQAQYIGLIKLTGNGITTIREKYTEAKKKYAGKIWLRGRTFENIYMTDLLQFLIDDGVDVKSVFIDKGWLEFDTVQDYEKIQSLIINGRIKNYCDIDFQA